MGKRLSGVNLEICPGSQMLARILSPGSIGGRARRRRARLTTANGKTSLGSNYERIKPQQAMAIGSETQAGRRRSCPSGSRPDSSPRKIDARNLCRIQKSWNPAKLRIATQGCSNPAKPGVEHSWATTPRNGTPLVQPPEALALNGGSRS